MTKDIYDIGEAPPLGEVPAKMYAQLIRRERFGEPKDAFKVEAGRRARDRPATRCSSTSMAAGINYNNVWAALGIPVDVMQGPRHDVGDDDRTSTSAAATRPASSTPSATTSRT